MKIYLIAIFVLFSINQSYSWSPPGGRYSICDYVVQPHDTLTTIAFKLKKSLNEMVEMNKNVIGSNLNYLQAGAVLKYKRSYCLKFSPDTHKVRGGETLQSIAKDLELHPDELIANNRDKITNGQVTKGTILKYIRIRYPGRGIPRAM